MYKPELAYRSDGPERGTRNEGLYMRLVEKEKTLGPFRRFVRSFLLIAVMLFIFFKCHRHLRIS